MQMPPPNTELEKATLTRHEELSPGVFVIGFQHKQGFLPGQAIKLGIDTETPPRIYSICSGTQELRYYICGQAAMAVETRDLLIEKGIPFGNIFTEIYF